MTRPHHIALRGLADDIVDRYVMGQKEEARSLFNQVPVDRRGYVAYHITIGSIRLGVLTTEQLETFFQSVTK
jgi:hypothetical protein